VSFCSEKCRVLIPVVEASEPEFEAGRSSARRNPVWLLNIEASEIVTSIGLYSVVSNCEGVRQEA
jgi:hypothetical protein